MKPAIELFKTIREKIKWMPLLSSSVLFAVYCVILSYPINYRPYAQTTAPKMLLMFWGGVLIGTLLLIFITFPKWQSIISFVAFLLIIVFCMFTAP